MHFIQRQQEEATVEMTRRNFAVAGAAAVALAGTASLALADEESKAPEGGVEEIYARTTLHAGFDPESPLTEEEIALILNAAFAAPTGGNQRAIDFFPVTDREILDKLGAAHKNYMAPQSAPFVVVIARATDREKFPELIEMDAGLAAGSMLTQAAALGISTCCLSIAPQCDREFNVVNALNIPYATINSPMYEPIMMVAFGRPSTDVDASASVLNYNAAQVHMNGFSAEASKAVEETKAQLDLDNREKNSEISEATTAAIEEAVLANV